MTIRIKSDALREKYRDAIINTGNYNPSHVYDMTDSELMAEYSWIRRNDKQAVATNWYIEQLLPYGHKRSKLQRMSSSDLINLYQQYFPVEEF